MSAVYAVPFNVKIGSSRVWGWPPLPPAFGAVGDEGAGMEMGRVEEPMTTFLVSAAMDTGMEP